jgi:spermidine/putrescine transport system substrate-binding protein
MVMNNKFYSGLILFLFVLVIVFGCSQEGEKGSPQQTQQAGNTTKKSLILYNWEDYIGSKTLENFEKETGIHVKEIFFEDEEVMLGAVQSDLSAYDLVVASDDLIREMREGKTLSPLDYSKIPNAKYIGQKYRNMPCDPELKYSVPYLWGTSGMVVNTKYIKEDTDSWKVLFDKRYKGRIAMLNNSWEVTAAASKLLGYSINKKSPTEHNNVKDLLLDQKPLLKGYLDAVTIQKMLIDEEIWAAQIYSGEGLVAVDKNENLTYVIPREGAPVWVDFFAMPRDAKHKEEVHIFLNYILRPEINASIASELWYATTNKAAKPLMDEEVTQSPSVYPSSEVIARCEFFKDHEGETVSFTNMIWTKLTVKD